MQQKNKDQTTSTFVWYFLLCHLSSVAVIREHTWFGLLQISGRNFFEAESAWGRENNSVHRLTRFNQVQRRNEAVAFWTERDTNRRVSISSPCCQTSNRLNELYCMSTLHAIPSSRSTPSIVSLMQAPNKQRCRYRNVPSMRSITIWKQYLTAKLRAHVISWRTKTRARPLAITTFTESPEGTRRPPWLFVTTGTNVLRKTNGTSEQANHTMLICARPMLSYHPPSVFDTPCVADLSLGSPLDQLLVFQAKATLEIFYGIHAAQMASSLGRWPMKITALTSGGNARSLWW